MARFGLLALGAMRTPRVNSAGKALLAGVGCGVVETGVDVEADMGVAGAMAPGGVDRRLLTAARLAADEEVGRREAGTGGGGSADMCDCVLE